MSMATRTDTQSPAHHVADSHDLIRVHGARVNNLSDVSIEIPKRRLTVFTGVSGSGKSSLVFSTIAAESQRMINETYSAFVQGFMPTLARPEVDVLDGLTTAIIVDQQRMGGDPRSTVGTATDANAMLRILFSRLGQPHIGSPQAFSFNVASISGAGAVTLERGGKTVKERRSFTITGGMCPRCEGRGTVSDIDLTQLFDDSKSIAEGAFTIPGWKSDSWWTVRTYAESGFLDPNKPIREFTKKELQDFLYREPTKVKVEGVNLTYEGLIPKVQKSFLSKGPGGDAAAHPGVRGPGGHLHRLSRVRWHPAQRGGPLLADRRDQHRRRLRDADQRPRRMGSWPRRAVGGTAARRAAGDPRLVHGDRAGLPLARAAVGHAVGWRGAAHQDDPPPRLLADRRHLRLRRAHHRPAPPRHPADERPAAAAAGQGQHGARRGARAGDDRDRRPRHRPRPRRRDGGRHRLLRGDRRGAAGQRHPHRPPSRRPGRPQGDGAHTQRHAGDPRRDGAQPARRRRRHPARGACRRHRRRRLRQELARARVAATSLGASRRGCGVDRPGHNPRLATEQPGDVYRTARPDPQGVREGQRREGGTVQRQLRGRLPPLQRRRRHLHRPWR